MESAVPLCQLCTGHYLLIARNSHSHHETGLKLAIASSIFGVLPVMPTSYLHQTCHGTSIKCKVCREVGPWNLSTIEVFRPFCESFMRWGTVTESLAFFGKIGMGHDLIGDLSAKYADHDVLSVISWCSLAMRSSVSH